MVSKVTPNQIASHALHMLPISRIPFDRDQDLTQIDTKIYPFVRLTVVDLDQKLSLPFVFYRVTDDIFVCHDVRNEPEIHQAGLLTFSQVQTFALNSSLLICKVEMVNRLNSLEPYSPVVLYQCMFPNKEYGDRECFYVQQVRAVQLQKALRGFAERKKVPGKRIDRELRYLPESGRFPGGVEYQVAKQQAEAIFNLLQLNKPSGESKQNQNVAGTRVE